MGGVYMSPETEKMLDPGTLEAFNNHKNRYPDSHVVLVDITDGLKEGKLSSERFREFLENSETVTQPESKSISKDLTGDLKDPDLQQAESHYKTPNGENLCVVSGNFTLQDAKSQFAYISEFPENKINMQAVPGTSADWNRLITEHELAHCAARHGEQETPVIEQEIHADQEALKGYEGDPGVPKAFEDARLLASFSGTSAEGMKAVAEVGKSVLMKQAEDHDTYLGITQGLSAEKTGEVKARTDALVYSMATQTEITRLGGIDAFNRAHPDMAGQIYQNPAEAFEGARTLMEAQKDPSIMNDPDRAPEVARALQNATNGARLVHDDPSLAYATVDAVRQNGMVPEVSSEAGLMDDYKVAVEKYVPDYADKDLGAEAGANFDNTVSKNAVAESNAENFSQPEPKPESVPDSQSGPAPDDEKPPAPAYNSGTSSNSRAPSFG